MDVDNIASAAAAVVVVVASFAKAYSFDFEIVEDGIAIDFDQGLVEVVDIVVERKTDDLESAAADVVVSLEGCCYPSFPQAWQLPR